MQIENGIVDETAEVENVVIDDDYDSAEFALDYLKKQELSESSDIPDENEQVAVDDVINKPAKADVVAAPVLTAPEGLDDTGKEVFAKLPPELQEYVSKITVEKTEANAFKEQYGDLLKPYENEVKQLGVEPKQALQSLLEINAAARNGDPKEYIEWYAAQRGFDLSTLNAGNNQKQVEQNDEFVDPVVAELNQKLQVTQQEFQQMKIAAEQQKQREVFERMQAERNKYINEMENTFKDTEKFPYAEKVKNLVLKLASDPDNNDLSWQQLYDKATRLDDNVYNEIKAKSEITSIQKKHNEAQKTRGLQLKSSNGSVKPNFDSMDAVEIALALME